MANVTKTFTMNLPDEYLANTAENGLTGEWTYTGPNKMFVLVDAATGKQMTNPLNNHSGSIVCTASNCAGSGYEAERAKSFGGVYVLERLASEDDNVAGGCASSDCEFDIGN